MFNREVLLYAEDDAGFAEIFKRVLLQAGYPSQGIVHVTDGEQALAYLKGDGPYADRVKYPLPGVALLDLKMPRLNGFEVLEWIRKKSPFPYMPVVMLTTSDELRDIREAYQLGANSFLTKPPNVHDLKEMLKMLDTYWFRFNVTEKSRTDRDKPRG